MHEVIFLIERAAHFDQLARRKIGHIAESRLRFDNCVEIAAIRHIHRDIAQRVNLDAQPLGIEKGRHIGEAQLLDEAALLAVVDGHGASGRIEPELARLFRRHQPVFNRHGHRADGAMPAHRQTA